MFRRAPQHEHKWISVASSDGYVKPSGGGTLDRTLVLQRCLCGAHNTYWLDGSWTPDQLGINDNTVRDLFALLNEINPKDTP